MPKGEPWGAQITQDQGHEIEIYFSQFGVPHWTLLGLIPEPFGITFGSQATETIALCTDALGPPKHREVDSRVRILPLQKKKVFREFQLIPTPRNDIIWGVLGARNMVCGNVFQEVHLIPKGL